MRRKADFDSEMGYTDLDVHLSVEGNLSGIFVAGPVLSHQTVRRSRSIFMVYTNQSNKHSRNACWVPGLVLGPEDIEVKEPSSGLSGREWRCSVELQKTGQCLCFYRGMGGRGDCQHCREEIGLSCISRCSGISGARAGGGEPSESREQQMRTGRARSTASGLGCGVGPS